MLIQDNYSAILTPTIRRTSQQIEMIDEYAENGGHVVPKSPGTKPESKTTQNK